MVFAARCFVGSGFWLGAAYLSIVLFVGAVSKYPSFLGWVLARRNRIALIAFLALVVVGIPYALYSTWWLPIAPVGGWQLYAAYVVIAIILGVYLRQICSKLAFLALLGKDRLGLNILTIAAWTVSIIMFPWSQHLAARPWYVGGFAVGIMAHSIPWFFRARNAAAYARIQTIGDAWKPGVKASAAELEALKLFTHRRFRKLRRKLNDLQEQGKLTGGLALVSAALYTHKGEHANSLVEVLAGKRCSDSRRRQDIHLLLLEAVSLKELNSDDAARSRLDQLLESEAGSVCPLARSTNALWLAEQAFANGNGLAACTEKPLSEAREAVQSRRKLMKRRLQRKDGQSGSVDDLLRGFVELGMPVTAASIVDVLAYCHLAAGYPEEAIPMYERCIEMDPDYSSTYLHLGDYFLRREGLGGGGSPSASDVWHSEACYKLASDLQRGSSSRIGKLARSRLASVRQERVIRRRGRR